MPIKGTSNTDGDIILKKFKKKKQIMPNIKLKRKIMWRGW